ncbi:MAG: hypothetical protein OXR73_31990 [Myxococcales bacterium]|nr:hypothetical protein [Myxococcales bacterium]
MRAAQNIHYVGRLSMVRIRPFTFIEARCLGVLMGRRGKHF